jgi:hypothetical protein
VAFCIWPHSPSTKFLRFRLIVTWISISSLLWLNNILLHGYTTFFKLFLIYKYLSAKTHFYLYPLLAIISIYMHVFVWIYIFNYLGYIPRNRITELYGNSTFYIFRNFQCFPSGCTILHSHELCVMVSISPHPY